MNAKALLQKFRSLPPHFKYPAIAAAAVVVLVGLHSIFDRPAPPRASGIAIASVPASCNPQSHPSNYWTGKCESARAKSALEASEATEDLCKYKGQIVGCACPPGSLCAAKAKANAKWNALIARERVGAAPPLSATSTKPAPATTTTAVAVAVATASTVPVPVPVPVVPVRPPAGVKSGLLHIVTEGQDSFGAWLTLSDRVVKSPTLVFTVPAMPPGASGARRMLVSAWVHVAQPTQTVTLRERGAAGLALTVGGQNVALRGTYGQASSKQIVAALQPGWFLLKAVGTEPPAWAGTSRVEIQLGSTNLNPTIPVPYWMPAKAPTKAAAPHVQAATALAPAATAAAPKPVPVPVKAGTARVGQATKEKKP